MASTLGVPLAWALLMTAQAAPAPTASPRPAPRRPAAPAQTSFAAVLAGKHAAGRAVDFPAVLLAPTAIQTTAKGQTRHFVIAVQKDSGYFRDLLALAKELREVGLPMAQGLQAVIRDDAKYRGQMKELDDLLGRAIGEKVARLAQVPPAEAVVVEVAGLESLVGVYNWENVVKDEAPAPAIHSPLPSSALPASLRDFWAEATMRRELVNLALGRPPDVGRRLPDFPESPRLGSERELESYNAAVELFNVELDRRRRYNVQRAEEDVRFFLARIEGVLARGEQTLPATVSAKVDIAAETYAAIHGAAPAVYVKERARGDAAFVKRAFQTASLYVTSFPAGASVKLDGQDLGPAPAVAPDLPVGSKVKLTLSRPGFADKEVEETIAAQPSGLKRLDLSLDPEGVGPLRLMSEAEGAQLFAAGFKPAKRFSLAVFATSERLGFKGKKDKDGAKRADAVRKAAAAGGWFELAVNPDAAEVMLEIGPVDPDAGLDAKTFRAFKITYRGEQEEDSVSESLSLGDEKAGASRLLHRIAEQLKQRRFERALGIEG